MTSTVPTLPHHCNSWVIICPVKDKALRETWNESIAQEAIDKGYRVETAAKWLASLNTTRKEA